MNIDEIFNLNNMAKETVKRYQMKRFIFDTIKKKIKTDRMLGILGPRGVGKTVILKQILFDNNSAIYISLDTLENQKNLFETIVSINKKFNKSIFLLDEVHYYKNFPELLKKLYDFTDIKILFTSSVALYFSTLQRDLSRRIALLHLSPFDFKEYLYFSYNLTVPSISFDDFLHNNIKDSQLGLENYFIDFIKGGLYPFSLEATNVLDNLRNVMERIINADILTQHDFTISEIQAIKSLLSFIGKSSIDGINYSSLSQNLGITKYKAKQYVEILERAFILSQVFAKGTNIRKEPKIVMALPYRLLYNDYQYCIGGLREDFSVEMLKNKGYEFYYLKSNRGEKRPDYLVITKNNRFVIEIGGKNKGYEQFKGIDSSKYKKLIFSQGNIRKNTLHLYLLGLLK